MKAAAHRVHELMATRVFTVEPDMQIMRAVHLMVANDISGVPVVDKDRNLLGILTERDCIEIALNAGYFDELGGQVQRYMQTPVETVSPETLLMDVAERFAHESLRRYPVTQDRRLVGMIFRRDILRALSSGVWFPAHDT